MHSFGMILPFLIIDSNIITLLYICTSMKGIIITWWLNTVVSSCGNVYTYYVHTWCFDNNNLFVFPHVTCNVLSVLNKLFKLFTQQDMSNNKKHVSRQTLYYNTIQHQQFWHVTQLIDVRYRRSVFDMFISSSVPLVYDYTLYVLGSVWNGLYYIVWHCVYRCVLYCGFVEYCDRTDVQIIKVNTVSVT